MRADFPRDVKPKNLAGGMWRASYYARLGKHRHESTKPGRVYIAIPPKTGWPGGDPINNGWKPAGGR